MSIPTSALVTISEQPDSSRIEELVREGLTRLAECIRKDGAPYPLTPQLVSVFVDVCQRANVTPNQIKAGFRKAETSCKFWPSPAEILGFISTAASNAVEEEAAQKFERVLAYAVRRSPDIPDRNPPKISERTRRAINAAGGLDHLRDCNRESLQWARKRFIEEYVRYGELQQDENLLLAGKGRELLDGSAEQKSLPGADAYEAARVIGESDRERLVKGSTEARQVAASPKEAEPRPVTATSERLELLKRQKAELLAKSSPEQIRRAEQLRSMCTRRTR